MTTDRIFPNNSLKVQRPFRISQSYCLLVGHELSITHMKHQGKDNSKLKPRVLGNGHKHTHLHITYRKRVSFLSR